MHTVYDLDLTHFQALGSGLLDEIIEADH